MYAVRPIRLALVGLVVAAATLLAAPSSAKASFAAIAYSESTGKYGYSFGFDSRKGAEEKARKECGQPDAKVVVWSENEWCALATSDNGPYGFAFAGSEKEAKNLALQKCRDAGGKNATIAVSIFSND